MQQSINTSELIASANELRDLLFKKGKELLEASELKNMSALLALGVLIGAFNWLKSTISDPFNSVLEKAKRLHAADSAIQNLHPLWLGPPAAFSPEDIPLFWKQCREAKEAIERLIRLLSDSR